MRKLLRVDITVPLAGEGPQGTELAERLEAWLSGRAAQGWEETPAADGAGVRFRVHLEDGPPARDFAAEALADWPQLAIETAAIEEEDWGAAWMAFFTPIEVGGVYEILPPWLEGKDTGALHPILIEPKMAFGTGHHPTTALCLEAFAQAFRAGRIAAGQRFLDLGTGSGILGIGLCRLGLTGFGLDIDPQAVWCAAENLRRNHVQDAMALAVGGVGSLAPDARFEVVVANILAAPLLAMAPRLVRHVAPGGLLVLSGVLTGQAAGVAAAYRAVGLPEPVIREAGEWASLTWG
ncbi:MAG: 50S ribosomal protein L11 methyltransferase [Solidesulfovibrio sp.]|uniref:50S ribosomal protein L11 methyltransferase n=1 Tax=Solidesulfovibrio sp. TaxID=2910990 RepID=UPI002B1FBC44|nr:50S ribosomal protein L11 methyltransferase [Solidesulfovibrio sp.]MEA4857771.1 50S ribosomal protein L11 methyltransferase [Solidesulfovibrio sp.]